MTPKQHRQFWKILKTIFSVIVRIPCIPFFIYYVVERCAEDYKSFMYERPKKELFTFEEYIKSGFDFKVSCVIYLLALMIGWGLTIPLPKEYNVYLWFPTGLFVYTGIIAACIKD